MGCDCQKQKGEAPHATQIEVASMKRITEVAFEPLVAVYEDDSSENPTVYGCGPAGCGLTESGHPTALRVERFSAAGVPHPVGEAHTPTEIELPVTLQEHYAQGASCKTPACLPWVRITRDPARFSECLKAARAMGQITGAKKVHELFKQQAMSEDQEVFYVLLLDTQLHCRGVSEISRGARDRVQTPIPDILRLPLVDGAMAIVVVHNHPSGKVTPSKADKEITQAINQACNAVGIHLFDHVIIGGDDYYSFLDKKQIK